MRTLYDFEDEVGLLQTDFDVIRWLNKNKNNQEFEFKIIYEFLKHTKPQYIEINSSDARKQTIEKEFNPTISEPNIKFKVKEQEYSGWYKPIFFIAKKPTMLDFVFVRGDQDSIYTIDDILKKSLLSQNEPNTLERKKFEEELLRVIKPIHLILLVKRRFYEKDFKTVSLINSSLKPKNILLVSEQEIPKSLKMMTPKNVHMAEKVDMNTTKFLDKAKKLF